MELVPTVVEKTSDPLVKCVGRQLDYIYNYVENVEELRKRYGELNDKMTKRNHEVEAAKRDAQGIEPGASSLLEDAKIQLKEIDNFLKKERDLKTRCLYCFPNLKSRHWLGRRAKKMSLQCDQWVEKEACLGAVSYTLKAEAMGADRSYESFKSREDVMNKVMNLLSDPTAKVIGIVGQGGVGKTILAEEIARKAEKLFSVVLFANITSTPDVRKIQGEMADRLCLSLGNKESLNGRAVRLRQRLRGEKKALVILDNLWSGLKLNMLGISFSDDDVSQMTVKDTVNGGQYKLETEKSPGDSEGCKILVTARSKEVISSEMDITEGSIIPLGVMEEEEAVKLFNKFAKLTAADDKLKKLSAQIAKRCAGLPLAIITVAEALRKTE